MTVFSNIRFLKSQKQRIVFTNGCFDVLHAGHVRYLDFCKDQGDVLVVALNSDSSISRLKGKNRPINVFEDRAYIISRLASVDFVIKFNEITPERLIRVIKPDVLIKGGDYITHNIAGSNFVLSYGGRVMCSPVFGDTSSTKIIKKLGLGNEH